MKPKTGVSHDEAMIRRLRKDLDFAAEYLKAALEDEDEPRVFAYRAAPSGASPRHRQSRQSRRLKRRYRKLESTCPITQLIETLNQPKERMTFKFNPDK
jgi:hypothetical protein